MHVRIKIGIFHRLFRRRAEEPAGTPPAQAHAPLASLIYTVFDTETTGMRPSNGDEIVAIGAVRISGGRMVMEQSFDRLVNPGRAIPPASTRVHGIDDRMVQGAPPIAAVLPEFFGFARGTVLVAHNAAFDMKFLQLREAAAGVRFAMPVLDTLVLSEVAHPHSDEHSLEAIAARLGVDVAARHTAIGDARVTGEIFLRLLPLLAAKGITTLEQALAASKKTYFAKVKY